MKFLSKADLSKLEVESFFPYKDLEEGTISYYSAPKYTKSYAGLEPIKNAYDLFTWDADDEARKVIKSFQDHCKKKLGWIPVCNNF